MPPDPNVHAGTGAIVQNSVGEFLIQRRANPDADGFGTLSIPGGWVDDGETPQAAVVREVLEETGMVVRVLDWRPTVITFRDDLGRWCVDHIFRCFPVSGEPAVLEPDKASWCGWMGWDELTSRPEEINTPLRKFFVL